MDFQVAFPSLETLGIVHLENLKIIWHDQLAENHMAYMLKQIVFFKGIFLKLLVFFFLSSKKIAHFQIVTMLVLALVFSLIC